MPTFDIIAFLNAKNKAKKGAKLQWSTIRFVGTGPAEKEWPVTARTLIKVAALTGQTFWTVEDFRGSSEPPHTVVYKKARPNSLEKLVSAFQPIQKCFPSTT